MTTTAIKNEVAREPRRRKGLAASAVPMLERVWIVYGRISKTDPRDGGGASVKIDDQIAQGVTYVREFEPEANILELRDNKSAFDPSVTREGWEEAMALIHEGRVAGIVGWHVDRLSRQPLQIELLWAACEHQGTQLHTIKSGHITEPEMLRFESLIADRESRIKADRSYDHHYRLAVDGKPHGGRRRFGWVDSDMEETIPEEVEAIKHVVRGLLGGSSLQSLARWLNAEGFKPPQKGKQWTGPNLGQMLKGPHLAGRRVYHGKDVGEATWAALITYEDHLRVKALLEDPTRKTSDTSRLKYLLPSIGTCATCGAVVRTKGGRGRHPTYGCATGRHVQRRISLVEAIVEDFTVARLTDLDERGLLPDHAAAQEVIRLRDYITAREAFKVKQRDLYSDEKLSEEDYQAVVAKVAADIKKARGKLATAEQALVQPQAVLKGMTGKGAAAAWAAADLDRRRAVLRVVWESIQIKGAAHSRAKFTKADLVMTPRDL